MVFIFAHLTGRPTLPVQKSRPPLASSPCLRFEAAAWQSWAFHHQPPRLGPLPTERKLFCKKANPPAAPGSALSPGPPRGPSALSSPARRPGPGESPPGAESRRARRQAPLSPKGKAGGGRLSREGVRLKILRARPEMRLPTKFKLLGQTSELKPIALLSLTNPRLPYFAPDGCTVRGNTKSCKTFKTAFKGPK